MNYIALNENELENKVTGAAFTVTTIMAIMCVAVMAIVVYKLFFSKKGTAQIPGGWKFTWN